MQYTWIKYSHCTEHIDKYAAYSVQICQGIPELLSLYKADTLVTYNHILNSTQQATTDAGVNTSMSATI